MVMLRDSAVGNDPIDAVDFTDHAKTLAAKLTGIRHHGDLLRHLAHHLIKVRFSRMRRGDPGFQTKPIDA